jgi:hypothetical protein
MIDDPNPYKAPIADSSPVPAFESRGPQGVPGPIALAWLGLVLAVGVVGSFFLTRTGVLALVCTLGIPPLRIAWVIYSRIQQRRYGANWYSGDRAFLFTMWIINIALLLVDAALIFFAGVCFLAISNANN